MEWIIVSLGVMALCVTSYLLGKHDGRAEGLPDGRWDIITAIHRIEDDQP